MGWWNAPDKPELTVGDAVLDLTRHFLTDFSRGYQEGVSRKPTLAELEYALNLAVKVNAGSDLFDGLDALEVRQVALTTAKRRRRQTVSAGDIFAFRLDDSRYGFGRIVTDTSMGAVAEFFDYIAGQPILDYSKTGNWLIAPTTIDSFSLLEARKDGDWRIIGHTPGYQPDARFSALRFVYGTPPHYLKAVDIHGKEQPVSAKAAKALPALAARGDVNIKTLIAARDGASGAPASCGGQ